MARPRLGEEERRTRTVGVRVTEAEAEELQERAQAARLSRGAYLRRRGGLGQRVRMAAERRLGAAELRELNRIGVNLNQMARAMNSGAGAPELLSNVVYGPLLSGDLVFPDSINETNVFDNLSKSAISPQPAPA